MNDFKYFSKNGEILPVGQAVIPISNIEYSYGFGVYETIRVADGEPRFLQDHLERLEESARTIELEHPFTAERIEGHVRELVQRSEAGTCNIKILLIGAPKKEDATLFILCLNPHFIDKKLYRDGVACITYEYERAFPHAKTLNMLQSYLAYRNAKEVGAYEALLIDGNGYVTEGTRTNFFTIKHKTIFSPPEDKILLGVTRKNVLKVATDNGFIIEHKDIPLIDIGNYDAAFLTSTSSKILPINSIGGKEIPLGSAALRDLMDAFDAFLAN